MRKQQERRSGRQWLVAVLAVALGLTVAGCSASVASNHEHEWEAATCETPRVCKTCGETDGEPLGHDWIAPTLEAPYTCARCGEQQGEPLQLSSFNRGRYNKWKENPTKEQYVGMSGYVAVTHCSYVYSTKDTPYENNWLAAPWYATTYEKDKQFFNPVGTVEHKTPVTVIGQELTDWQSGVCCYHGFLLVERVDNGEQFYISVTDFVTEPYWEVTNANDVGAGNPCLAVYHQRSDYYPVDRDGKKYNAADGEVVMIFGATNWGGIDRETNQVDVLGANGRGFFNAEDLTVIY